MVIAHLRFDRWGLNGAKQDSRRPQIAGLHAQIDDLANRGVAQQLVGNLDGDFHRGLGGAFVSIGLICVPLIVFVFVVLVFVGLVIFAFIVLLALRNAAGSFGA